MLSKFDVAVYTVIIIIYFPVFFYQVRLIANLLAGPLQAPYRSDNYSKYVSNMYDCILEQIS